MERLTKKERTIFMVMALFVIFAYLCRAFHIPFRGGDNCLRALIYASLYIWWGISLYHRVNHPQMRRYVVSIAVLLVIWQVIRLIKFSVWDLLPNAARYLYYLPMLFVPMLAVLVSLAIGLPEQQCLPKKAGFLYVPAALLLLLVMTNDLHQWVFTFPEDAVVFTDKEYGYSFGFILVVAGMLLYVVAALVILSVKCRLPNSRSRVVLPCIPIVILLLYMVLNILRVDWLYTYFGDMTAVYCLMYAAAFELCIQCGLIQTNTGYDALFLVSRLGAQITDTQNIVRLTSANAQTLTPEQRLSASKHPVFTDKTTLVKSQTIPFGHVLWQEDMTELTEAIEQSEENCRELAERNRIRQQNLETKKKLLTLREKNRVSDLLHQQTAQQIMRINELLCAYDSIQDETQQRRLLAGIAAVGAYVKRYGNLLLIGERAEYTDIRDLSRCFEESFVNLELLNIECFCSVPSEILLKTQDMIRAYRVFECALEACFFDLNCVWVNAREQNEMLRLRMEFVCDASLDFLAAETDDFSQEDETKQLTLFLQKGGEQQ